MDILPSMIIQSKFSILLFLALKGELIFGLSHLFPTLDSQLTKACLINLINVSPGLAFVTFAPESEKPSLLGTLFTVYCFNLILIWMWNTKWNESKKKEVTIESKVFTLKLLTIVTWKWNEIWNCGNLFCSRCLSAKISYHDFSLTTQLLTCFSSHHDVNHSNVIIHRRWKDML